MSETVERVAEAIYGDTDWKRIPEDHWEKAMYRRKACAVIAAICEPTPEMEDAGARILSNAINEPYLTNRELASKIFQAMIGAARENSK